MVTESSSECKLEARVRALEAELEIARAQLKSADASAMVTSSIPRHGQSDSHGCVSSLTRDELQRSARQIIVPQIGLEGQLKLKCAKIAIVGAGGLGCPAMQYLAGAGIGTIGLIDGDIVEISNLHRQVLYNRTQQGLRKVDAAAQTLFNLNEHVNIEKHFERLTAMNYELLAPYDIVLDCTDNQESRYLISDACVLLNKPLIWAAALKLEGQLCTFNYKSGPCYRCLFPKPTPDFAVASCSDSGILGPVVGAIGTLQALQAIRMLTDDKYQAEPTMVIFSCIDGLAFRSSRMRSRQDNCAACGNCAQLSRDTIAVLNPVPADQTVSSTAPADGQPVPAQALADNDDMEHIDVSTTQKLLGKISLIDVRPKVQYEISHLPYALSLPMADVDRFPSLNLPQNSDVYVYCKAGITSKKAIRELREKFPNNNFINVDGGLKKWAIDVDPSIFIP